MLVVRADKLMVIIGKVNRRMARRRRMAKRTTRTLLSRIRIRTPRHGKRGVAARKTKTRTRSHHRRVTKTVHDHATARNAHRGAVLDQAHAPNARVESRADREAALKTATAAGDHRVPNRETDAARLDRAPDHATADADRVRAAGDRPETTLDVVAEPALEPLPNGRNRPS